MKDLQNAYMATLLGNFDTKSLDSQYEFGHAENGNPNFG